jgi:hypothetical protein
MVWLTRSQVYKLVEHYTQDEGVKDMLRRAVWRPRMLERGWAKSWAGEFMGTDTGFADYLRNLE